MLGWPSVLGAQLWGCQGQSPVWAQPCEGSLQTGWGPAGNTGCDQGSEETKGQAERGPQGLSENQKLRSFPQYFTNTLGEFKIDTQWFCSMATCLVPSNGDSIAHKVPQCTQSRCCGRHLQTGWPLHAPGNASR